MLTLVLLIARAEKDHTGKKRKCLGFFIFSVEEKDQVSIRVKLPIYFPHLSDLQWYMSYLKFDLLFPSSIESFFTQ